MGIILGLVGIGFLLIFGIVAYSLFSDAFDKVAETLDEQQKSQNDQVAPGVEDVGNLAKDTGGRVCNLKVEFVGSGTGESFSDDVKLWNGNQNFFGITAKHDPAVIHYQWFCVGQASLTDMMLFSAESKLMSLASLVENNLLRTTDNVIVRMYFTGDSLSNGRELVASKTPGGPVDQLQFSNKIVIAEGTDYPFSFNIPVYLYDVTEDNYLVDYWNDQYIFNERNPGHHFTYKICKPGQAC